MEKWIKEWIDNADYETLLEKWRFAPVGDPFFQGEAGNYYQEKMAEKKKDLSDKQIVSASKNIGW